jgi:hypothetical protein
MSAADELSRLAARLRRQYPGIHVEVHFNDHVAKGMGTYQGWSITFESKDPNLLIRYKLAPLQCDFGKSSGNSELVNVRWWTHGIIDQSECYGVGYAIEEEPHAYRRDRALTKTRQTQVVRMLKPFIRGTWKPQTA